MKKFVLILLIAIVISCGCVERNNNTPPEPFHVGIDVPDSVFPDKEFSVYLDIINNQNKTYVVEGGFYDLNGFESNGECSGGPWVLDKKEIKIIECKLKYPKEFVGESSVKKTIRAYVKYTTNITLGAQLLVLSEDEYILRKQTNNIPEVPTKFEKTENDIKVIVEFQENPFVITPTKKKAYMYVTIKNVGEGTISEIDKNNFEISLLSDGRETSVGIVNCNLPSKLYVEGDTFPKISCEIDFANANPNYLNLFVIIKLRYSYDLRRSAQIKIEV